MTVKSKPRHQTLRDKLRGIRVRFSRRAVTLFRKYWALAALILVSLLIAVAFRLPALERGLVTTEMVHRLAPNLFSPDSEYFNRFHASSYADERNHWGYYKNYINRTRVYLQNAFSTETSATWSDRLGLLEKSLRSFQPEGQFLLFPVTVLVYSVPAFLTYKTVEYRLHFYRSGRRTNVFLAAMTIPLLALFLWIVLRQPTMGWPFIGSVGFATLGLALTPAHIVQSQVVSYNVLDVFAQLAAFLVILGFFRKLQGDVEWSGREVLLYFLALSFCFFLLPGIKWSFLPLVPVTFAGSIWVWWKRRGTEKPIRLLGSPVLWIPAGAGLLGLAGYASWIIWITIHRDRAVWVLAQLLGIITWTKSADGDAGVIPPKIWAYLFETMGTVISVPVVLSSLVAFGIVGYAWARDRLEMFLLSVWFLLVLVAHGGNHLSTFPGRNLLPGVLALLVISVVAYKLFANPLSKGSALTKALVGVVLVLMIGHLGLKAVAMTRYMSVEDVRTLASHWLVQNIPRGEKIGVIWKPWWSTPFFLQAVNGLKPPEEIRNYYLLEYPERTIWKPAANENTLAANLKRWERHLASYDVRPEFEEFLATLQVKYFLYDSMDTSRFKRFVSPDEYKSMLRAHNFFPAVEFKTDNLLDGFVTVLLGKNIEGLGAYGVNEISIYRKY